MGQPPLRDRQHPRSTQRAGVWNAKEEGEASLWVEED